MVPRWGAPCSRPCTCPSCRGTSTERVRVAGAPHGRPAALAEASGGPGAAVVLFPLRVSSLFCPCGKWVCLASKPCSLPLSSVVAEGAPEREVVEVAGRLLPGKSSDSWV